MLCLLFIIAIAIIYLYNIAAAAGGDVAVVSCLFISPGGAAIKKYAVMNDKRHILTKDTDNNVAIYDVLKVTKIKDLGPVDFDNEFNQHNIKVFIPNWFTVDLKTGVRNSCLHFFYHSNIPKSCVYTICFNVVYFMCVCRCQLLFSVRTLMLTASVRGYQLNKACLSMPKQELI